MSVEDFIPKNPVDATAAKVVSSPGPLFQHQYKGDLAEEVSKIPLPTKPITRAITCGRTFTDMTGETVGRLKVIGLAEKSNEKHARWVCRCSCGNYVYRKTSALKRNHEGDEHCAECNKLKGLKKRDYFNRHGKWPDE